MSSTTQEHSLSPYDAIVDGGALFDLLDDGVLLLDGDGIVRYVNHTWAQRLGFPRAGLVGTHISALCSGTFSGLIKNQLAKVLQKGESTFKSVQVNRQGHEIYVDVSAKLLLVNEIQMTFCQLRDLSLRREHAHMQELMQFSIEHTGDAIFWIHADGRIAYANEAACESLGYLPIEMLALRVLDIDPLTTAATWEAHWAEVKARKTFKLETLHRSRDGTVFPVEVTVNYLHHLGDEFNCAIVRDISLRKEQERALRQSEKQYREVVESARSIVLRWSPEGLVIFINEYGEELLGYAREELIGRHVVGTITPETESTSRDLSGLMDDILKDPDKYRLNINENMKKNGERVWLLWTNRPVLDEAGNIVEVLSIGNDITQQRKAEEELKRAYQLLQAQHKDIVALQEELKDLAIRDPLTGAFNRRFLEETLQREISRCERDLLPLSIIMLDVDYFKSINDRFGHQAGDAVLQGIASFLASNTRTEDVVCRYGGEEFIVVLPGTSHKNATERAEEWRAAMEHQVFYFSGREIRMTISLGVGALAPERNRCDEIIAAADSSLYQAKNSGRNRVVA
jgi:diguanylate cyclase (GGDEF)-like protein/PAS domain S-box-containing protein